MDLLSPKLDIQLALIYPSNIAGNFEYWRPKSLVFLRKPKTLPMAFQWLILGLLVNLLNLLTTNDMSGLVHYVTYIRLPIAFAYSS